LSYAGSSSDRIEILIQGIIPVNFKIFNICF